LVGFADESQQAPMGVLGVLRDGETFLGDLVTFVYTQVYLGRDSGTCSETQKSKNRKNLQTRWCPVRFAL